MTTPLSQRVSLVSLSARDSDGVIVVSLRGELDFVSCSVLQTYLSDIRWPERARCVVDLTGLTFIDCACLGVLVRHCEETRARGGSFALAGPQGRVRRILSGHRAADLVWVHGDRVTTLCSAPARSSPPL